MCTVLFGVEPTDVKPPLSTFQNTQFHKDDFKKLVQTINRAGGESTLTEAVVESVFEKWWPDLYAEINKILAERNEDSKPLRTDRELLEEVLENVRRHPREMTETRRLPPSRLHIPTALLEEFESASHHLLDAADKYSNVEMGDKVIEIAKMMRYLIRDDLSTRSRFDDLIFKLSTRKDEIMPF